MKALLNVFPVVLCVCCFPLVAQASGKDCLIKNGNGDVVRTIPAGESECNGKHRYTCESSGRLSFKDDEDCIEMLRSGYSAYNTHTASDKIQAPAAEEDSAKED